MDETERRRSRAIAALFEAFFLLLGVVAVILTLRWLIASQDPDYQSAQHARYLAQAKEAPARARALTVAEYSALLMGAAYLTGRMACDLRKRWREADFVWAREALYPALYRKPSSSLEYVAAPNAEGAQAFAALFGKMPRKQQARELPGMVQSFAHPPGWDEPAPPSLAASPEPVLPLRVSVHDAPPARTPALAFGVNARGQVLALPLADMGPVLIAGLPGSGKTEAAGASMAYIARNWPDGNTVRVALCDIKGVDFYGLPPAAILHAPPAYNAAESVNLLAEIGRELEERARSFRAASVGDITTYNAQHPHERKPYIVVYVDELSRVTDHPDREIAQQGVVHAQLLAEQGRAFGIVPVFLTQRPAADTVSKKLTGIVDAQLAFRVASHHESQMVIGVKGAENLDHPGRFLMRYKRIEAGQGFFVGVRSGKLREYLATVPQLPFERRPAVPTNRLPDPDEHNAKTPDEPRETGAPVLVPIPVPDEVPQDVEPEKLTGAQKLAIYQYYLTTQDPRYPRDPARHSKSATVAHFYKRKDDPSEGQKGGQAFRWVSQIVDEFEGAA